MPLPTEIQSSHCQEQSGERTITLRRGTFAQLEGKKSSQKKKKTLLDPWKKNSLWYIERSSFQSLGDKTEENKNERVKIGIPKSQLPWPKTASCIEETYEMGLQLSISQTREGIAKSGAEEPKR